jgi:penicillin-binding protein 1C
MSAPGKNPKAFGCGLMKFFFTRQGWKKIIIFFLLAAGGFWLILGCFPDPLAQSVPMNTVRLVDRNDKVLTKLPASLGYRENRALADFSPHLIQAVLAAEDARFYCHPGIDPLALLRAAFNNLTKKDYLSGGSTITMQLARLTLGLTPGPRTLSRKFKEIWLALIIERHHSKDEILAAYLNAVPTGPQRWGLATAGRDYFNKDIAFLSPAEAAFLASLPKSPNFNDLPKLLNRQKWILGRLKENGHLDEGSWERALSENVQLSPLSRLYLAPHFLSFLKNKIAQPQDLVNTTIDLEIQFQAEKLINQTVTAYQDQGLSQAAVVILSLPKREILAWVGSADFFDPSEGQNDGVLALRQPGSALKPFIYQLAISEGLITAATILEDKPLKFNGPTGAFTPQNYGRTFHGQIPVRQALAGSLNIPAINLINRLGPEKVLNHLRNLGLMSLTKESDYYGLGLALGNGEVSLLALTNAYATLALGGLNGSPVFEAKDAAAISPMPAMDPDSAWIISNILSDDEARILGFGRHGVLDTAYPSAVKTGTSQNFRDNWCFGFTDKFVIGVWAGNFQSDPMQEVSGVTGAGQLWRQMADYLAERDSPKEIALPPGVQTAAVCPLSGLLLGPDCPNGVEEYFLKNKPLPAVCDHGHMELLFQPPEGSLALLAPLNNEIFAVDPGIHPSFQNLYAHARTGPDIEEVVWQLNGQELFRGPAQSLNSRLLPLTPGPQHLVVLAQKRHQTVAVAQARYLVKSTTAGKPVGLGLKLR